MEYTNDVIFKVRYKKDEIDKDIYGKHKLFRKLIRKIEDDEYLTLVVVVSIATLTFDFLIVKQFVEIVKLL